MAKIVLGLGTSHGPMLVTTPDLWDLRLPDDRRNPHPWRGRMWSYEELIAARRGENLAAQTVREVQYARYEQCQRAVAELARVYESARPDIAVIVGNDQMEVFNENLIPAFSVLWGTKIVSSAIPDERLAKMPPGIPESIPGYIPPGGAVYPAQSDLAKHIISCAMAEGFDVASMRSWPKPETPHAFGFIYRHIMRDNPIPSVPILINTFYPPNQPTARRCYDFGKTILRAIQSWPSDLRVMLVASGGLTHFAIDEDMDARFFEAFRRREIESIAQLGEGVFQDGTSEVKNWIPVAGAMADLGYEMTVVDYVPCYRSVAGTGNAMGFVYWRGQ